MVTIICPKCLFLEKTKTIIQGYPIHGNIRKVTKQTPTTYARNVLYVVNHVLLQSRSAKPHVQQQISFVYGNAVGCRDATVL